MFGLLVLAVAAAAGVAWWRQRLTPRERDALEIMQLERDELDDAPGHWPVERAGPSKITVDDVRKLAALADRLGVRATPERTRWGARSLI